MTTEAIYQKYWDALTAVEAVMVPADTAIALALRLAIGDAYAAGSALADDLAAIVASQATPERSPADQRYAEQLQAQISRLNEWLQKYAPALYHNPDIDTAAAVLMEIGVLRRQLSQQIDDHADLASARRELVTLIAERDSLRQQLAQMDADNAGLTLRCTGLETVISDVMQQRDAAQEEIDRLTRQNAIAVDTFNSLHTNGAAAGSVTGLDPTAPAPMTWGRACTAWDNMSDEERVAIYDLFSGRMKFGELPIELRTEILTRVLRHMMNGSERLKMCNSTGTSRSGCR